MNWWNQRQRRQRTILVGVLIAIGVLAAACNGDDAAEVAPTTSVTPSTVGEFEAEMMAQVDALGTERNEIAAELVTANNALAAADTEIGELEEELDGVNAELVDLKGLEGEIQSAEQRAGDAEAALTELLAAYDPELAASRDELLSAIDGQICDLHASADPTAGSITAAINQAIQASPEYKLAFDGWAMATTFDIDQLTETVNECNRVVAITSDKGSGFYTVGDEIAPGKWRSTGTDDSCYWARLDSNQEILDNHFGDSGGTVTIRSTDYEVEFSDCGTWEYLG